MFLCIVSGRGDHMFPFFGRFLVPPSVVSIVLLLVSISCVALFAFFVCGIKYACMGGISSGIFQPAP